MVRVLIGNNDNQKVIDNFKFLKENNEYEIITSKTGLETIKKCSISEPSIIILNSSFPDMHYTSVIDKISNLPNEYDKCNLILTVNNIKEKMSLSNTSIIYKIFNPPFDEKIMAETVSLLKTKFETPALSLKELKGILLC